MYVRVCACVCEETKKGVRDKGQRQRNKKYEKDTRDTQGIESHRVNAVQARREVRITGLSVRRVRPFVHCFFDGLDTIVQQNLPPTSSEPHP